MPIGAIYTVVVSFFIVIINVYLTETTEIIRIQLKMNNERLNMKFGSKALI